MAITAPGLDRLIAQLEKRQRFISSQDGAMIDKSTEIIVPAGPFLHQDTEEMSEMESANFEKANQLAFDYLRSIKSKIYNYLKP